MKITEKEFNVITGEETITEREETAQEIAEREEYAAKVATQQAEANAKQTQREAIAERLGLTAEELQILLG